jgi:hypothetical protein
MQRKKGAKSFAIAGAGTVVRFSGSVVFYSVYLTCFWAISFIVRFCDFLFLKRFCGKSCFDLLELPETVRAGWN